MPTENSHVTIAARWRVLRAIDELLGSAGDLLAPRVIEELRAGRARLAQARFNLAVLGEFKRGKSTLINALLGREVLPTGVVPLTSMVTVICHGPRDRLIVHYRDGRETEHPVSELAHFATEHGNPHNRLGVELTTVELPAELLVDGLQLIDTPGIGSVHEHNTAVAWGFLPRVDAAVCVLTADQPFAQSEREFFAAAAARVPRLLLVVNKIDHLQRGERQVALEFIEGAADELLAASEVEYFALSAREGEGVARLSRRIAQLAERESHALLVRSIGRLTAVAARDAAQAIEFEAQAIELTLGELRRRAELFAARAEALRAARAEAADLLERGVERLLEERVRYGNCSIASRVGSWRSFWRCRTRPRTCLDRGRAISSLRSTSANRRGSRSSSRMSATCSITSSRRDGGPCLGRSVAGWRSAMPRIDCCRWPIVTPAGFARRWWSGCARP
jgi:GTP-binding protein EngB required for normal cell division